MDGPPGELRKKVASYVQQSLNRKDSVAATGSQQRQTLEQLRADLLNGFEEEDDEEEQRSQGSNTTMVIGGLPRRIRSNPDQERLNALVRDVRYSARTAKNQEINRQAKLATLSREVEALNMERARFSWRAPRWDGGETWRSVNIAKRRSHQCDALHRIPPEHRLGALRAIERTTAANLPAWNGNGNTMRSRVTSPRLTIVSPDSTIMPVSEQEYAPSEGSCRHRASAALAPSPSASPRAMGQTPSPKASLRGSKTLVLEGPSPRRATPTASPK